MNEQNRAGFSIRFLASFIDGVIIACIVGLVSLVVTGNFSLDWINQTTYQFMYTVYFIIVPVLWGGYVIGKRICRIKVKRIEDDGNVTLINMILRELIGNYLLAILTFSISVLVSAIMIALREDKRGLHDLIGGTYVGKT